MAPLPEQPLNPGSTSDLAGHIKQHARSLGFELAGITSAAAPETWANFESWLDRGFAGEMTYLEERRSAYAHPDGVMPGVRSVILLAMNYYVSSEREPEGFLSDESTLAETPAVSRSAIESAAVDGTFRVARYAWGRRDYHHLIRERARLLADELHRLRPGCRTRVVVDTAPLLERDFARRAGLGWFGKNTMLINKRVGSWFFLSALLTDVELPIDAPHETSHCGTCTRCLEICPTDAFVAPYELDARRCISYLTIEQREAPVPLDLRESLDDWLFGCDLCQEVCPWNRRAPESTEMDFCNVWRFSETELIGLLSLDEPQFHERFRETPFLRTGRSALLRNTCYVLGNRLRTGRIEQIETAVAALEMACRDASPLIQEAAAWALHQHSKHDFFCRDQR